MLCVMALSRPSRLRGLASASLVACLVVPLALVAGCECEPAPMVCTTSTDCPTALVCIDQRCVSPTTIDGSIDAARGDGGGNSDGSMMGCPATRSCRSNTICCADGEECVAGYQCAPACPNTRCGDNQLTCCGAGQQCLDGIVCASACEAGRELCGENLDVCCGAGEVCVNDACLAPGATCRDDYDCLTEGTYCETAIATDADSGTNGRCVPLPAPPLCEVRPQFDRIQVEVERHWPGVMVPVGGTPTLIDDVLTTPVVGDISGDGIPDFVFPAYGAATVLVAVSGVEMPGTQILPTLFYREAPFTMSSGIAAALANFDDEPALEIVYVASNRHLKIIDGDGTELLDYFSGSLRTIGSYSSPTPLVSDLNHDGLLDVVVGCQAVSIRPFDSTRLEAVGLFDFGGCARDDTDDDSLSNGTFVGVMAIANLDGDPDLEVTSGGVALNVDGSLLWDSSPSDPARRTNGTTALADFGGGADDAGLAIPEIVVVRAGRVILRDGATGQLLVGVGGAWLDQDVRIPGGGSGGAPTVADFDGDGKPEIGVASAGRYTVFDLDCIDTPPPGRGPANGGNCEHYENAGYPRGQPNGVLDAGMDTGVRDAGRVDAFRPDAGPPDAWANDVGVIDPEAGLGLGEAVGFVRWIAVTQDLSSSVTGSSVFDFQGDGIAEVIYNDECFLHIYDGRTGAEVIGQVVEGLPIGEPWPNSSRTSYEYPLVVDADRDGNSEIVVPANNDQIGRDRCVDAYLRTFGVSSPNSLPERYRNGTAGLWVLGDPNDRWVRTRPIWNQFAYYVTNVDDLGQIPTNEAANWRTPGLNNYRQNVQGAGVFNAPNLALSLEVVAACGSGVFRLSAVVTNAGSRGVPAGLPVEFLETSPNARSLRIGHTTRPLLPGGSERVTVTVDVESFDVPVNYEARVNDQRTAGRLVIEECDDDDNDGTGSDMCTSVQ